jgi:hypothetical protein
MSGLLDVRKYYDREIDVAYSVLVDVVLCIETSMAFNAHGGSLLCNWPFAGVIAGTSTHLNPSVYCYVPSDQLPQRNLTIDLKDGGIQSFLAQR